MSDTEKCFCHFEDFAVKDAKARNDIELLNQSATRHEDAINQNTNAIRDLDDLTHDHDSTISQHGTQINGIISDVQKNTAQIAQNAAAISQHGTQINGIISDVQKNTAKIAQNAAAIESLRGISGIVTLTAANWTDQVYTLTVDDLGDNDSIHFTPSLKTDKTALDAANVFIAANGQTVTFEADTAPTSDIALKYFIVRGA